MILVARNLASFLPYTPQAPARDNECNVARLAAEISEFDIVAVCTVATRGRLAASCPLLLLPIAHFSAQSLIYQVTLCYGFQPEGRVQLTLLYSTVTAVLRIANTSNPRSLTGQTTHPPLIVLGHFGRPNLNCRLKSHNVSPHKPLCLRLSRVHNCDKQSWSRQYSLW
jgi:hypothetical protein